MKIGIIGTGMVGRILAEKLSKNGHDVRIGTRNVQKTLASTEKDGYGNPPFCEWHKTQSTIPLVTFHDASAFGDIIFNATQGAHSIEALKLAGEDTLKNKIIVDVSNPLDFSKGMPPSLLWCNTDSQGERIQSAFPSSRVVKTLNTVNAYLMVDPGQLAEGDHTMFMAGNDDQAKEKVAGILKKDFGWKDIIDLGDITNARATEMLLPIWVRLWGKLQKPMFSIKVIR